jgi:hypothetical protein
MEELSTSFNAQDQAPDDSYVQDRRSAPCICHIPCKGSHVNTRLLTKQDILHLFLQLGSQDSTQELFRHTIAPSRASAFRGSSFSCVAFGPGLLVKVWFVFIVLALEVTSWIASMLHVFSSIIYAKAAKCFQGYTRSKSSRTFPLN